MSQLLEYNYAVLNDNDQCVAVLTYSCEVPLDTYILIPNLNGDYMDKYYDRETGIWYYDAEHTEIFDPEA